MSIEFSPNFRSTGVPPVALAPRLKQRRDAHATKRRPGARRLAANRANARKSTGPRSAAGKRRVARNALKHGLCAQYGARLPSECDATFSIFLREIEEDLRPATTLQRVVFAQIANLLWRLERLPQAQADLFSEELPKAAKSRRGGETLTPAQVLARRFSDDRNNGFILLDRYERAMRNALLRLLRQFDQLGKRQRPEDPEERVPREGDRPAWTMEKQKHQEQTFDRREQELKQHVPPRDEYEASVDLTMWRCAQARRLAEQQQLAEPGGNRKQTALLKSSLGGSDTPVRLGATYSSTRSRCSTAASVLRMDEVHPSDSDKSVRATEAVMISAEPKQTQSNPTETLDSQQPEGKCRTLQPPPATEQTHSSSSPPCPLALSPPRPRALPPTLSPRDTSHKFAPPTFQKGPCDA